MNTYFLKFPDEDSAHGALTAAGLYQPPLGNNPGYYKLAGPGWACDPIGPITEGGIWDQVTGEELEAPTILAGWHLNYAGSSLPPELEEYELEPAPSTPYRVFAGV
jgi:hypothetical protein